MKYGIIYNNDRFPGEFYSSYREAKKVADYMNDRYSYDDWYPVAIIKIKPKKTPQHISQILVDMYGTLQHSLPR